MVGEAGLDAGDAGGVGAHAPAGVVVVFAGGAVVVGHRAFAAELVETAGLGQAGGEFAFIEHLAALTEVVDAFAEEDGRPFEMVEFRHAVLDGVHQRAQHAVGVNGTAGDVDERHAADDVADRLAAGGIAAGGGDAAVGGACAHGYDRFGAGGHRFDPFDEGYGFAVPLAEGGVHGFFAGGDGAFDNQIVLPGVLLFDGRQYFHRRFAGCGHEGLVELETDNLGEYFAYFGLDAV